MLIYYVCMILWIESHCSVKLCLSAIYMFFFPTNSPGSSCISFRSESKVISGMGPALGQALAGFVGSSAGWRAPFALVGAAGLVMLLGQTCGCWRVFGFVGLLWVVQGFNLRRGWYWTEIYDILLWWLIIHLISLVEKNALTMFTYTVLLLWLLSGRGVSFSSDISEDTRIASGVGSWIPRNLYFIGETVSFSV